MICSIIQWMISRSLDSDGSMSSFVDCHVGRCGCCREFLATSRLIGLRLVHDAGTRRNRPDFVEEMPAVVAPRDYSFRLAVLTACILVLGGFMAFHSPDVSSYSGSSITQVMPEEGMKTLLSMTGITPETVAFGSGTGLGTEIDNLALDARSAVQHLAGSLAAGISVLN
jgi:hypothetical protein